MVVKINVINKELYLYNMHAIHQEREFLMDFFYNYYFGNTMSTNTLINSYNTIETKLIKIKELADKV
ncbi:hypothetical protein GW750_01130 [bacterium]|nr:hypothetical protein [bacterium]